MQRRFRYGIENLMLYVSAGMLAVFLAQYVMQIPILRWIVFSRAALFQGEFWRLVTFIFIPPSTNPLWLVIGLFFYYYIGSVLEREWGTNKLTFYYLIGIIGNILAGLLTGGATNHYLNLSLFFAFAQLFPENQIRLYMIIPVKVKWVAWVLWAIFAFDLIRALMMGIRGLPTVAAILVSILNFLLFFGPDLLNGFRAYRRRKNYKNNFDSFWR